MNHIERFFATVERKPVDRPASWLGLPVPSAHQSLKEYFKISSLNKLTYKLDDDIFAIEMPYHSPSSNAIYTALNFSQNYIGSDDERTLTVDGFFKDYSEPSMINDFDWPDPEKHISIAECERLIAEAPKDKVLMGVVWSSHFQDACAAFGMENAMVKMLLEPEMFQAVINRIVDFYLQANEIFYKATKGNLHAVLIGNDLGSQTSLMISPELIKQFVLPGTIKLVEQAHKYGLKVVHHSCGAIYDIIEDLILSGVDVIHPIQALATGMDPKRLKDNFGDRVAFCGGVDAQHLLVNGKPEDVAEKVKELCNIFPTGLIISPSHEAILPDVPPKNIEALFNTLK